MFSQEKSIRYKQKIKKWKDWKINFTEENSDTGNGRSEFNNQLCC